LRVQFWIFTKFPIILGDYCKQYQPKTFFTGYEYNKYVDGIRGGIGLMVKYHVITPWVVLVYAPVAHSSFKSFEQCLSILRGIPLYPGAAH